jgi:hypothetical protein
MAREKSQIYCPKCGWKPAPEDRWSCEPQCGTVWNTFWTRGMCPGCSKQWSDTQCLACHQFSPHRQWYHAPEDERSRRRPKETTVG